MRKNFAPILLTLVVLGLVLSHGFLYGAGREGEKLPPEHAGAQTCEACHQEIMANLEKTPMGRLFIRHPRNTPEELVCESCHGPAKVHADSEGAEFGDMIRFAKAAPTPAEKRNEACLQCHRKKNALFWDGSPHDLRQVSCSNCHKIHTSDKEPPKFKLLAFSGDADTCSQCHKQQAAQQMRFSHHPLREGKMSCSSCHNPHGTFSDNLLKANTVNDLCYGCHKETRGPVLFEHQPVREDCSICHSSHGSNYPRLLKAPQFRLCRDCHVNFHTLSTASGGGARRSAGHTAGRLCTSCHINIHGSNHPAGFVFTR